MTVADVVTPVVAIVGVLLAVGSLGWQVKTLRDAGVKVLVSFVVQLHETQLQTPLTRKECAVVPQGDEPRTLAMRVQNAGRQQAVVAGVTIETDAIAEPDSGGGFPARA